MNFTNNSKKQGPSREAKVTSAGQEITYKFDVILTVHRR